MIPDENIKIVFFSSRMVQDCVYKYMYAQRMPQDCRILIPWLSVSCHGLVMHYILYWIVTLSIHYSLSPKNGSKKLGNATKLLTDTPILIILIDFKVRNYRHGADIVNIMLNRLGRSDARFSLRSHTTNSIYYTLLC